MHNYYQKDLTYIHDVGFGDFAQNSANGIVNLLSGHHINDGLIIELGCGSGILTKALITNGYRVIGVDISRPMIQMAKKRAPKAEFINSSFLEIEFPNCNAVIAIGEVFNYQFHKHNTKALIKLFKRAYKSLHSPGALIFDIAEPGYLGERSFQRTYSTGRDWAILVDKAENKEKATLIRKMTIFRRIGKYYRRSEETHEVRLYKRGEIANILKEIGFKVKLLKGYGENRFRTGVIGFMATK